MFLVLLHQCFETLTSGSDMRRVNACECSEKLHQRIFEAPKTELL
jgi:hypothetical protein